MSFPMATYSNLEARTGEGMEAKHTDHDSSEMDGPQFDTEDLILLNEARHDPKKILTTRPIPLGYLSVACIIANRMIGTGIFRTPSTVMLGTSSVGVSLIFWVIGAIVSLAGILVYTEFGLTIPRYTFDMTKESVPRSGGEKNYLEYLLKRPKYLATCLYGVAFILLGNMAGNGVSFAEHFLLACGVDATNGTVRGMAIGVVTFACLIHGLSRKAGIVVNNTFGIIKVLMLLMVFIVGMLSAAGVFALKPAKQNLSTSQTFRDASTDSYGYSAAFLAIIFAFGGFNQANYVWSRSPSCGGSC
jgi:amino acid transporter